MSLSYLVNRLFQEYRDLSCGEGIAHLTVLTPDEIHWGQGHPSRKASR